MSNSTSSNKENNQVNFGIPQANKITRYLLKRNCVAPLQHPSLQVKYDNANNEGHVANPETGVNETNCSPNQRKNKLRLPKRNEENKKMRVEEGPPFKVTEDQCSGSAKHNLVASLNEVDAEISMDINTNEGSTSGGHVNVIEVESAYMNSDIAVNDKSSVIRTPCTPAKFLESASQCNDSQKKVVFEMGFGGLLTIRLFDTVLSDAVGIQ